jgi:uncharacterized repeat protein (TIGR01451 family)
MGGAVFNHYGTLTVTNCTFSGNRASGGDGCSGGSGYGGAVFNLDGRVLIQNSTLVSNSLQYGTGIWGAGQAAGGALYSRQQDGAPSVTLRNTILANTALSSTNDFSMSGSHAAVLGGYNLVENDGGQLSGLVVSTADPRLRPLQNNGGVGMWTHALLTGSPAINTGDPGFTAPPEYDQRGAGYPRVVGGRVDIGAYEAPLDLHLVKTIMPASTRPGATITYTLVFSSMNATATGVVLTDTLPVSVSVTSVISSGVVVTDTGYKPAYVWQVEDLAPGATGCITVTAVVSASLRGGVFTNTAVLAATNSAGSVSASAPVAIWSRVYLPLVKR